MLKEQKDFVICYNIHQRQIMSKELINDRFKQRNKREIRQ